MRVICGAPSKTEMWGRQFCLQPAFKELAQNGPPRAAVLANEFLSSIAARKNAPLCTPEEHAQNGAARAAQYRGSCPLWRRGQTRPFALLRNSPGSY